MRSAKGRLAVASTKHFPCGPEGWGPVLCPWGPVVAKVGAVLLASTPPPRSQGQSSSNQSRMVAAPSPALALALFNGKQVRSAI